MYKILILTFSLCVYNLNAQKSIKTLINAETAFAAYAVEHGTQPAFVKNLDSNSVSFNKGKPVNGFVSWSKTKNGPGILNWYPHYAEIAISGDLGYTFGPWTYQPKTINDSIVARGGFNSVWKLDSKGEWKNIVDLGVDNMPPDELKKKTKIIGYKKRFKPTPVTSIESVERSFIAAFEKNPQEAYKQFLSRQSALCRNIHSPAIDIKEQQKVLEELPSVKFSIQGSGISKGGDLGYIYGSAEVNGKTDNYIHIWRMEKEGWKLALDVLRY